VRKYGIAVDPGVSTGVCLFSWGHDRSFLLELVWQFAGGAGGLHRFLDEKDLRVEGDQLPHIGNVELDAIIVEKFTPRGGPGFSLTQAAAEPLRGEGVLIGHQLEPFISWAEPSAQYFMGGTNLADRKKRAKDFLKSHDLHLTGRNVGQKDANDAISAILHSVAFMRKIKHKPTLDAMFPEA
jgi:hypothetical protein